MFLTSSRVTFEWRGGLFTRAIMPTFHPGVASPDDAIFSDETLFQEQSAGSPNPLQ